jgi:hypothetical protein
MEILIFSLDDDIIDIAWCTIEGHQPPKGKKYRILVDRLPYVVHKETITGKEILELAGKEPYKHFQLRQKFKHGKVVTIGYDQHVDLTAPGIEKFKTLPLDQTEGEVPRRDFDLLEEDELFLENLGLPWETVKTPDAQWLFIQQYPVIPGYNVSEATMGIRMTPGYPTAQLDMVYFFPALSRKDGQPIGALTTLVLDGQTFQQWSRHRTGANPWRPELDNLSTHVPLADAWLSVEFEKRPTNAISA